MTRLSRRERECLRALARQTSWPARSVTGWLGEAAEAVWVPATRRLLAALAEASLVVDESTPHLYSAGDRVRMALAARYTITDTGRAAADNARSGR